LPFPQKYLKKDPGKQNNPQACVHPQTVQRRKKLEKTDRLEDFCQKGLQGVRYSVVMAVAITTNQAAKVHQRATVLEGLALVLQKSLAPALLEPGEVSGEVLTTDKSGVA